METEIDNKIVIVYGKMGKGKSMVSVTSAIIDFPNRVYSNLTIHQKGLQINKNIKDKKDIENIRFSYTPGLIIIDEAGINMNSRMSMSEVNKFLSEIVFLSRKKNCSMIFVAQRFESIDLNIKSTCDLILEMNKIRRFDLPPLFIVHRKKQIGNDLKTLREWRFNMIGLLNYTNTTYDTLESGKINFKEKIKDKFEK